MIICPICGAQNDPANRFCDQCGARLDTASTAEEKKIDVVQSAPTGPVTCPQCGAPVLPGEVFCNNCGCDLREPPVSAAAPAAHATHVPSNAETIVAPPSPTPGTPPVSPDVETMIATAPPVSPDVETMIATPPVALPIEPVSAPPAPVLPDGETIIAQPPTPVPGEGATPPVLPIEVPAETPAVTPVPSPEAPAEAATPVAITGATISVMPSHPLPPEPDAAPPAAPAESPAAPAGEHQRLLEEMERHRKTISQMEQMIQAYPPSAPRPEFLTQGLEGARRALAQTEAKLASLSAAPPAPDPAELSRLEQLISVHRDTITQFEQMKQGYPPDAVPGFIEDGLKEAERALAQVETNLAALRGGTAPAMAEPEAPAVPPPPATPGPRLVMVEGKNELLLPTDKEDIIIGREDPVSHIFPEIDLTPYGGESGGVSRQHARMNRKGNQWTIIDLNSTNHTRVDGTRIEPDTPTPIQNGSRIQFGRISVIFYV